MVDRKKEEERIEQEVYKNWRELSKEHWSHWRAWGSWFSWGSPTGLGLFFISIAVTLWILSQAFGWK